MSGAKRAAVLILAVIAGLLWVVAVVTFVPDSPSPADVTPTGCRWFA